MVKKLIMLCDKGNFQQKHIWLGFNDIQSVSVIFLNFPHTDTVELLSGNKWENSGTDWFENDNTDL